MMKGPAFLQPRPPEAPGWARWQLSMFAAVVGVGLLLRTACAIYVPSPLESDYLGYWTIANNFYNGRGLTDANGEPTAFLSLGYPIFLTGIFFVLGPTIAAVKAANVVLGTASVALVYLITRRLFASAAIAIASSVMVAVYLEAIVYTSYVAKENLMIFLLLAQIFIATSPRPTLLHSVLLGGVTGALAMVGNAALALLPAVILLLFLVRKSQAATSGALTIAAVVAALVMAPLAWRNHQVFGGYNVNNNGGFNLYIGNNPNATPYFESITETPIGDHWHEMRSQLGERGADLKLRDLAIQHIISHPLTTLDLAARKAAAFWWPSLHSGKTQEGSAVRLVRVVSVCQFAALCALFLAASVNTRRRDAKAMLVLWAMVLGYTAVHMLFYVIYRYRLPIMPVVCIGAGFGLCSVASRAAHTRVLRSVGA